MGQGRVRSPALALVLSRLPTIRKQAIGFRLTAGGGANRSAHRHLDRYRVGFHDAGADFPGYRFRGAFRNDPLALHGPLLGLEAAYSLDHFLLFVDRLTDDGLHLLGIGLALVAGPRAAGA